MLTLSDRAKLLQTSEAEQAQLFAKAHEVSCQQSELMAAYKRDVEALSAKYFENMLALSDEHKGILGRLEVLDTVLAAAYNTSF